MAVKKLVTDDLVTVNFRKLSDTAKPPNRIGDTSIWELYSSRTETVDTGKFGYIEYGTGIAVDVPTGYIGIVYPASSISFTGLFASPGMIVIPNGSQDEIRFRFMWIRDTAKLEIGNVVGHFRLEYAVRMDFVLTETFEHEQ